jgi:hypothetical protein
VSAATPAARGASSRPHDLVDLVGRIPHGPEHWIRRPRPSGCFSCRSWFRRLLEMALEESNCLGEGSFFRREFPLRTSAWMNRFNRQVD